MTITIATRKLIAGHKATIARLRATMAQNESDELQHLESLERIEEQKTKISEAVAEETLKLNQVLADAGMPLEEE